jgi:hypothetical protein
MRSAVLVMKGLRRWLESVREYTSGTGTEHESPSIAPSNMRVLLQGRMQLLHIDFHQLVQMCMQFVPDQIVVPVWAAVVTSANQMG